jgi:hypothetical protein
MSAKLSATESTLLGHFRELAAPMRRAISEIVANVARHGNPPVDRSQTARLRRRHYCEIDATAGFVQLPPLADGTRVWRCLGCQREILRVDWKGEE